MIRLLAHHGGLRLLTRKGGKTLKQHKIKTQNTQPSVYTYDDEKHCSERWCMLPVPESLEDHVPHPVYGS